MKSAPKRKTATVALLSLGLFLVALLVYPTAFQRGNPLPYLTAMKKLSEGELCTIVEQSEISSTYLTKLDDSEGFPEWIAKTRGWRFIEQGGSAYIYEKKDGERVTVASEVYWRRYLIWDVPK